jgi:HlyD family secretion protein
MKIRWMWLLMGTLVLLSLVYTGWKLRGTAVDAVEVRMAPLVRTVQFSARVATLSRVDIGSTLTGRVAQVLVREGDTVRLGDALVQLESDELRATLEQAVANERQAQARLAGIRTSGRLTAQAAVAQADAGVQASLAEMERAQQLVTQGFVSASRLDEAKRLLDVAQAQQASARAQLQANADTGTDATQAEAQLAVARAAASAARAKLEQTFLRAPAHARVLSRDAEPGQIVQPGRALIGLAIEGPTLLRAQVDERFLEQLRPGQKAMVVADAFADQRFAAHVLSIAPAVDAQRGAVEVKLALEQQPPGFLREDMTLSVEVETARHANVLALPLAALRGSGPGDAAWVLVAIDGRAQERRVRPGLRTLQAVEIVEGLGEGDAVLIGSAVKAGDHVRTRLVAAAASVVAGPSQGGGGGAALTNAMGR